MEKIFTPRISLSGGIGNQLFQWAAAHVLFEGSGFSFDLGHYRINKERDFQLASIAEFCRHTVADLDQANRSSLVRYFEWAAFKGAPTKSLEFLGYFREDKGSRDFRLRASRRAAIGLPVMVNGLFQDGAIVEQAFKHISSELDAALRQSLKVLIGVIDIPKDYVAVHVRRGDYPISSVPSKAIGQLDDDYFSGLLSEVDLPIILLTENSYEVRGLSTALNPYKIISSEEANPLQTLALMADAQLLVGSNSSLSWWGAYLAAKRGRDQWLPRQWSQWGNYENSALNLKLFNFSPSSWKSS